MTPYGVVTEHGTVRLERVLKGPIEQVWEYLTDSDKRGTWLAEGSMDLRPGDPVALKFNHANLSSEKTVPDPYRARDGKTLTGTITGCEPPRLLSFTWDDDEGANSEVKFELTPQSDGNVLLAVTHSHLPNHQAIVTAASGWGAHLGILEDTLNGVEPRPFWTTHAAMEREHRARL